METIVGTRIHDEILALIDRAEAGVVLVSPFVKMWPELRRTLARAVARGVSLQLITRGPKGGPRDEDLAVFADLDAEIKEVPQMHLKAYFSEKEALHTSVNLTRESVDKSLESSLLFRRRDEPAGWNSVYEIWHKTLDDIRRGSRLDPEEFERRLTEPLRPRADAGDDHARADHRYCISCGNTASNGAEHVLCLRCRAAAIAADADPDETRGGRCARCNGAWRFSKVDKPFCEPCYRSELDRYARRPARWYVHGTTGAIEAWTRLDGRRGAYVGLEQDAAAAVASRWGVLMGKGGWLTATLTAATPKPVPLWNTAVPEGAEQTEDIDGVVVERVPIKVIPACRDLPDFPRQHALHVALTRVETPPTSSYWTTSQLLASWDADLPRHQDLKQLAAPSWLLMMMLAPRKQFATIAELDPGRSHVRIDTVLAIPADLRPRWKEAARWFNQVLLSALHSYDAADVRSWLAAAQPKTLDGIVAALSGPAPFGPAKLVRDERGQVRDVPHRPDRLAAIRVQVEAGERWHVRATVSTVKALPLN